MGPGALAEIETAMAPHDSEGVSTQAIPIAAAVEMVASFVIRFTRG